MLVKTTNKFFNSLVGSKFFSGSSLINKSFIYFVSKQVNKFKVLFFFLLVSVLLGSLPRNKNKSNKFICFYFSSNFILINNLVLLYLPILGFMLEVESKHKNNQSFSVLSNFPPMFEFEIVCENYSLFLDYFLDFKFIFFFSFKLDNLALNETVIRLLYKLPIRYIN